MGNPISELRGVTCQMDHTSLLVTRHKRTHPALTAASKADLATQEGWKAKLIWVTYYALHGRESNSRPLDRKSDALTTVPPRHHCCISFINLYLLQTEPPVTLRYGAGFRCLLQFLSTSGDKGIMLFLHLY